MHSDKHFRQLPDLREFYTRGRKAWRTRSQLNVVVPVLIIFSVTIVLVVALLSKPESISVTNVITPDGGGGGVPPVNTTAPYFTPSTGGVACTEGCAIQGQQISVTQGTWSNSPSSYSYQWEKCTTTGGQPPTTASCSNAVGAGATTSTYTVDASDVGKALAVEITATNTGGSTSTSVTGSCDTGLFGLTTGPDGDQWTMTGEGFPRVGCSPISAVVGANQAGERFCTNAPITCGFPDSSNTGVPPGTTLQRIPQDVSSGSGWSCFEYGGNSCAWINITGNGTVFQNYTTSVGLVITGDNVTVRNVNIQLYGQDADGIKIGQVGDGAANAIIEHCTLHGIASGNTPNHMYVGVLAMWTSANLTVRNNNVYNVGVGFQYAGIHGLVQDNFVHDTGRYAYPPETDPDHNVDVGFSSGSDTEVNDINHNTFLNNLGNYVAEFNNDDGVFHNGYIRQNLLVGGGGLILGGRAGGLGSVPGYDTHIDNNRFSRMMWPAGGRLGTIFAFNVGDSGNTYTGNIWDDSGAGA